MHASDQCQYMLAPLHVQTGLQHTAHRGHAGEYCGKGQAHQQQAYPSAAPSVVLVLRGLCFETTICQPVSMPSWRLIGAISAVDEGTTYMN
jgi:hypothetical protein